MPPEFRPGPGPDDDARHFPDPAGLARSQVAQLQAHIAVVAEADKSARDRVIAGLADAPTRDLANLRRYERAALRRLEWVKDQMDRVGLRPRPQSVEPRPTIVPPPDPTPATPPVDPAPPRVVDQTKPPAAPATAPAAPEDRPRRPDLARFHRRNRRSA